MPCNEIDKLIELVKGDVLMIVPIVSSGKARVFKGEEELVVPFHVLIQFLQKRIKSESGLWEELGKYRGLSDSSIRYKVKVHPSNARAMIEWVETYTTIRNGLGRPWKESEARWIYFTGRWDILYISEELDPEYLDKHEHIDLAKFMTIALDRHGVNNGA